MRVFAICPVIAFLSLCLTACTPSEAITGTVWAVEQVNSAFRPQPKPTDQAVQADADSLSKRPAN